MCGKQGDVQMNKVILMGRLAADPELKQTPNGVSSCRIRVAVNRSYSDKSTGQRQADFITCVAWRQTAEFINRYFRKGSMIMVEGSLRTGSYQDKKNPEITRYTTEVYIDNVEFTGSKTETGTTGGAENGPQGSNNTAFPQGQAETGGFHNNDSMSVGSASDYEEILGGDDDGKLPF